jgi:hypothetical protein
MKPVIKINFTDFWPGFDKSDNYFSDLLARNYTVEISDRPVFLFYSCYGHDYLKFNCIRIFFSAENMRPDFTACDYALTFDLLDHPRHFRLPLFFYYIDQRGKVNDDLVATPDTEEIKRQWSRKEKFCCMVVSNGKSKKRIEFFKSLSKFRKVDSGGVYLNNVGGPVPDKLSFIRDYKFVIAFENSSYPGYTTEKLFDPLLENCIPVYWGNPKIHLDFNKKRFLNYDDFASERELIEEMFSIESNPDKALKMLVQPMFPNNKLPSYLQVENLIAFLTSIVNAYGSFTPVAQTPRRYIHKIKRKKVITEFYINKMLGRNFR